MAQWTGQYSGKTHQSKVLDREEQLRHAIEVFRSKQSQTEAQMQAKKVFRLADKLLSARVRAMKACLNARGPRSPDNRIANEAEAKIERVVEGGILPLLREFDAADIAERFAGDALESEVDGN